MPSGPPVVRGTHYRIEFAPAPLSGVRRLPAVSSTHRSLPEALYNRGRLAPASCGADLRVPPTCRLIPERRSTQRLRRKRTPLTPSIQIADLCRCSQTFGPAIVPGSRRYDCARRERRTNPRGRGGISGHPAAMGGLGCRLFTPVPTKPQPQAHGARQRQCRRIVSGSQQARLPRRQLGSCRPRFCTTLSRVSHGTRHPNRV